MNTTDAFTNGKAFIPFVTCGDPDIGTTEKIILAMQRAGADMIEIGVPFSDPTAEGPVIQEADMRALKSGTTPQAALDMVKRLRPQVNVPLVFMTYANVVFSRGVEHFITRMADAGVDGLILPDVPFEEKEEFAGPCRAHGIDFISMIAPTSHERIRTIASQAEGFIYCISSLGVTGVRDTFSTDIGTMIETVRSASDLPCAVGFGISTPQQASDMAHISDGAIVGSAIVKIVAQYGKDSVDQVSSYVARMKAAVAACDTPRARLPRS